MLSAVAVILSAAALHSLGSPQVATGQACVGQTCPVVSQAESSATVSDATLQFVTERGVIDAAAEHCGLDVRVRSYEPMLAYFKDDQGYSEEQMALVIGAHSQGKAMGQALTGGRPCAAGVRAAYDRQLDFGPPV